MKVAFVIEGNEIVTAVPDELGVPRVFSVESDRAALTGKLIIDGHHAYTDKTINHVKMAKPELPIFERIFSEPNQRFVDINEHVWKPAQLFAILFKKLIFQINSHFITPISAVRLVFPPAYSGKWQSAVLLALRANGMMDLQKVGYKKCIDAFWSLQKKDTILQLGIDRFQKLGRPVIESPGLASVRTWLKNEIKTQIKGSRLGAVHPIDQFGLDIESERIFYDLLANRARPNYQIILQNQIGEFQPDLEDFTQNLNAAIESLKNQLGTNSESRVFATGSALQYECIRTTLKSYFSEDLLTIDDRNLAKPAGALNVIVN